VEALWRAGIFTSLSCQDVDGKGRAWIRLSRAGANRLVALLGDARELLEAPQAHGAQDLFFELADLPTLTVALRGD
jgi:hypothetical protein